MKARHSGRWGTIGNKQAQGRSVPGTAFSRKCPQGKHERRRAGRAPSGPRPRPRPRRRGGPPRVVEAARGGRRSGARAPGREDRPRARRGGLSPATWTSPCRAVRTGRRWPPIYASEMAIWMPQKKVQRSWLPRWVSRHVPPAECRRKLPLIRPERGRSAEKVGSKLVCGDEAGGLAKNGT